MRPISVQVEVAERPDRLLTGLVGGTVALVALYATGVAAPSFEVVTAWVFIAAVHVCLAAVAYSTARTTNRRFWLAVTAGAVIYLIGDLAQIGTVVRDPGAAVAATGGRVQLIALSLGSALLMLTLLTVPLGFASRRERSRFWLDLATVMVAAVVVGWYLVVPDRPADLVDTATPVLAGPVILLLCVFVVAKLVMSRAAPFTRACGLIGAGGAAVKSAADGMARDGLTAASLHWFLALTVAAHALLAIALRVNQIQLRTRPGLLEPGRQNRTASFRTRRSPSTTCC